MASNSVLEEIGQNTQAIEDDNEFLFQPPTPGKYIMGNAPPPRRSKRLIASADKNCDEENAVNNLDATNQRQIGAEKDKEIENLRNNTKNEENHPGPSDFQAQVDFHENSDTDLEDDPPVIVIRKERGMWTNYDLNVLKSNFNFRHFRNFDMVM